MQLFPNRTLKHVITYTNQTVHGHDCADDKPPKFGRGILVLGVRVSYVNKFNCNFDQIFWWLVFSTGLFSLPEFCIPVGILLLLLFFFGGGGGGGGGGGAQLFCTYSV